MNESVLDTNVVKCPKCGANMKFSIKSNALKCSYCGEMEQIETGNNNVKYRKLTDEILNQHAQWNESVVFRCVNCGAQVDMDKKEIVKNCPFCGSSNILKTDDLTGIKPDSVIPFTITKQSAVERFKKWIKSKLYAPRSCKKAADVEHINAIYHPTWIFNANTQNYYNGTLGEDYTETHTDSNGNTTTTTHTRWYKVSGNISAGYRNITIPSGKIIPKNIINSLGAYPFENIKNYKQEYLAGKFAEHYSRDINVCFSEFGNFVYSDLCTRIKHQYHADHVRNMNINTKYVNKHFNYTLLPAYIAYFKHKDKNYNFYINGATGKLVGNYPKSGWKILFTVLGIAAAVIGAAAAIIAVII